MNVKKIVLVLFFLTGLFSQKIDFSSYLSFENRYYSEKAKLKDQKQNYPSISVRPKFLLEWADGEQQVNATLFARYDFTDKNRSHFDIRELYWNYYTGNIELNLGMRKVYWGVAESAHLVDIINQTDFVESFDGEQKLGQPMAHIAYISEYGTFNFYVLPFFREREFPGKDGRLRSEFLMKKSLSQYESSSEEKHIDYAFRWTRSIDLFDIGLSHFYGTSREALFNFSPDGLVPYYELIHQTGLDLQITTESVLYKFELIRRESKRETMTSLVAGFEYTFSNIKNTGTDIGIVSEYLFDDRNPLTASSLNNDVFIGARVALNDIQSTEFLIGSIVDLEKASQIYSIEASRRFADNYKLYLELRAFNNIDRDEAFYPLRNDSFVQLTLERYF
jgi:hypothetical protein